MDATQLDRLLTALETSANLKKEVHRYQGKALLDITEYILSGDPAAALRYISHRLTFLKDLEDKGPQHAVKMWSSLRDADTKPLDIRNAELEAEFYTRKPDAGTRAFLEHRLRDESAATTEPAGGRQGGPKPKPRGKG